MPDRLVQRLRANSHLRNSWVRGRPRLQPPAPPALVKPSPPRPARATNIKSPARLAPVHRLLLRAGEARPATHLSLSHPGAQTAPEAATVSCPAKAEDDGDCQHFWESRDRADKAKPVSTAAAGELGCGDQAALGGLPRRRAGGCRELWTKAPLPAPQPEGGQGSPG